jgi:hypothetical protein
MGGDRMNRGVARKGFALITAVITSAAILATIVGIATLTMRETRVQAAQGASNQALAVAERGLAEVVSRFRADKSLAKQVIALTDGASWELPPSSGSGGTVSPSGHAFYWVKVIPQGAANGDRSYLTYAAGFVVRPNVSSFSASQLKTLAASTTEVLARRVVQLTSFGIVRTSSSSTGEPGTMGGGSPFDYGLFTGDSFQGDGSKNLANATTDGTTGIYAKENISITDDQDEGGGGGRKTLTNLELYAEKEIDVGENVLVVAIPPTIPPPTVASISHEAYDPPNDALHPTFPVLDLEAYMDLFDAFVAGTEPFDGTVDGYPNLSNDLVRAIVLSALGNPQNNHATVGGQVHHFVTPDSLSSYTAKVVSLSLSGTLNPEQSLALKSTLSRSVFYVRQSASNPDAKWQSDRTYLAGVIVCSGKINFTGCPDFADGQVAAFLSNGEFKIAGSTKGDSQVRGIFYTTQTITYTGSGLKGR